jgi:hypothetical protein
MAHVQVYWVVGLESNAGRCAHISASFSKQQLHLNADLGPVCRTRRIPRPAVFRDLPSSAGSSPSGARSWCSRSTRPRSSASSVQQCARLSSAPPSASSSCSSRCSPAALSSCARRSMTGGTGRSGCRRFSTRLQASQTTSTVASRTKPRHILVVWSQASHSVMPFWTSSVSSRAESGGAQHPSASLPPW